MYFDKNDAFNDSAQYCDYIDANLIDVKFIDVNLILARVPPVS